MIGEARFDFVAGFRQAGYDLLFRPDALLIWPLLGQVLRQCYSNIPNAVPIHIECSQATGHARITRISPIRILSNGTFKSILPGRKSSVALTYRRVNKLIMRRLVLILQELRKSQTCANRTRLSARDPVRKFTPIIGASRNAIHT